MICLLIVVLSVGGLASTAHAYTLQEMLQWYSAACTFAEQVNVARNTAIDTVAVANGLANYAYDRTEGDALIADAVADIQAGDPERDAGIHDINDGVTHSRTNPFDFDLPTEHYSNGMCLHLVPAKASYDAANAHANAAIATFWTTEQVAMDYLCLASSYQFAVLDETYGAKTIGWCEYENARNQRQYCQDQDCIINGDFETYQRAYPALSQADNDMVFAADLLLIGDGYYAVGDWLLAAVYYDKAYDSIQLAEEGYYHGAWHAQQAIAAYFPE